MDLSKITVVLLFARSGKSFGSGKVSSLGTVRKITRCHGSTHELPAFLLLTISFPDFSSWGNFSKNFFFFTADSAPLDPLENSTYSK
jgi:hypothetical protein